MAAPVKDLPTLIELPILILNELLQYTDVRLQAALRRTCVLFNHLLLPSTSFCRDIRIFIPPTYSDGYYEGIFLLTLRSFHGKCLEWFGCNPIRRVIIDGPYDSLCNLTTLCQLMNHIEDLHFQEIIFVRQTFRDPVYLGPYINCFWQHYLKTNNRCQQLTFHDVIFSPLQNVLNRESIIGKTMGWAERKAYMLREQIIPIRGSLDVHSARFDHDLMDLIERHCPELDEEQMADIMQWKATCSKRLGIGERLREFVAHDDRPCNALYSKGWNQLDQGSPQLVTAARAVDVRQMTEMARTAFFYCMKQARQKLR